MGIVEGKATAVPILHIPSILEKTYPSLSSARDSTFESRGNVFTCKEG
jgi:hypothetical protein